MTSFYLNYLLRALAPKTVIMKFRASTYRFWRDTVQLITNGDLGRCVGRRRRGKAGEVSEDVLHSSGHCVPRAHRAGRCLPLAGRNHSEETGTLLAFAFHSGTSPPSQRKHNSGSQSHAYEAFKVLPPTAFSLSWSLPTSEDCRFDWGAALSNCRCTLMGLDLGFHSLQDDPK